MACPKLNGLTDRQKSELSRVVQRWKASGKPTEVLEEGLKMLTRAKRPSADQIVGEDSPCAVVACDYGKRYRFKLSLSREDASILLGMVKSLREAAQNDETTARKMVELAAGVVLEGKAVPTTITDPSWGPVLRLLSEVAPSLQQRELF